MVIIVLRRYTKSHSFINKLNSFLPPATDALFHAHIYIAVYGKQRMHRAQLKRVRRDSKIAILGVLSLRVYCKSSPTLRGMRTVWLSLRFIVEEKGKIRLIFQRAIAVFINGLSFFVQNTKKTCNKWKCHTRERF